MFQSFLCTFNPLKCPNIEANITIVRYEAAQNSSMRSLYLFLTFLHFEFTYYIYLYYIRCVAYIVYLFNWLTGCGIGVVLSAIVIDGFLLDDGIFLYSAALSSTSGGGGGNSSSGGCITGDAAVTLTVARGLGMFWYACGSSCSSSVCCGELQQQNIEDEPRLLLLPMAQCYELLSGELLQHSSTAYAQGSFTTTPHLHNFWWFRCRD